MGIYIHIPFCRTKCVYCDFYSCIDVGLSEEYKQALCRELMLRSNFLSGETVETIYIGGGTPSLFDANFYQPIFDTIYQTFSVSAQPEITLEANPDDLTETFLAGLTKLPVNRISIGVQSFIDSELQFMKRRHSAAQAEAAVKRCQDAGYLNISIDLMYGLPEQSLDNWRYSLQQALQTNVGHISAYHITYEEDTPVFNLLKEKKITPLDEEKSLDMFELLIDRLTAMGFLHYEISNFARDGFVSRHNSAYWKGIGYLGIGASAHSCNVATRTANIADTQKYIAGIKANNPVMSVEHINDETAYNEFVITSLRTVWGLSLSVLKNVFGCERKHYFLKQAEKYLASGLLECISDGDVIRLTRKGIFVSDGIMSNLLIVSS